jgi:hypothetical protein
LVSREHPGADNNRLGMKIKTYLDPETGELRIDRRSGKNRRGKSAFSSVFTSTYRRRKSRGRRRTDKGAYVDLYDSRSWSIAIAVLVLSLIDAVLTGMHIKYRTAWEVNPVMNAILNFGGFPAFFGAKAILTVIPMAVIVIHKEWTLGKYAARLILASYICLTIYHLYLIYGARKIVGIISAILM